MTTKTKKREYRTRVATFEKASDASIVAKKMIPLPRGWRCIAEDTEIVVYGPRPNWSFETGCRISAFIEGYRAAIYV